jgi:hypothetical protein
MVKKIRREGDRTRNESAKAILLIREQKNELKRMRKTIRKMEQHDRTYLEKVARLFQPDGEVQTKARLYDEKITQPGVEEAARVKNIVKEYAAQVEEALVGFRALVAEVLARCPPVPEAEVGETSNRGGRVPLSGSVLQETFRLSGDAPQAGDLDRLLEVGGSPPPEQTSRPVEDVEPVQAADQGEASLAGFLNPEEEMVETDAQQGEEGGPEGGPGGNPDGQPDGAQGREPKGEQQEERGELVSEPGVPNHQEDQEEQQEEETEA